jgi:hypothetical protein
VDEKVGTLRTAGAKASLVPAAASAEAITVDVNFIFYFVIGLFV